MSMVYLLHHCDPLVLWWAIALLDQNQLSGGSFASLLQTVKIAYGSPFPKKLLDLLPVLPPRQTLTDQTDWAEENL